MDSKYVIRRRLEGMPGPEFWIGKMSISFDGWSPDEREAEQMSFGAAVLLVKACNDDPRNRGYGYGCAKVDLHEMPRLVAANSR